MTPTLNTGRAKIVRTSTGLVHVCRPRWQRAVATIQGAGHATDSELALLRRCVLRLYKHGPSSSKASFAVRRAWWRAERARYPRWMLRNILADGALLSATVSFHDPRGTKSSRHVPITVRQLLERRRLIRSDGSIIR